MCFGQVLPQHQLPQHYKYTVVWSRLACVMHRSRHASEGMHAAAAAAICKATDTQSSRDAKYLLELVRPRLPQCLAATPDQVPRARLPPRRHLQVAPSCLAVQPRQLLPRCLVQETPGAQAQPALPQRRLEALAAPQ